MNSPFIQLHQSTNENIGPYKYNKEYNWSHDSSLEYLNGCPSNKNISVTKQTIKTWEQSSVGAEVQKKIRIFL